MQSGQEGFEIFGNYVLLKSLATGGMAEVFLARPANTTSNGRAVVVKRILKHIANDPEFLKMFRAEIRVSLGFNHPHTIQIYDFGEIDYQPYIAIEYIEGKSLKQIAQKFEEKNETIPVPTVLGLMVQAASGLHYAHSFENGVTGERVNAVHRDVSPHNLLLSYHGNLKVIDFGVAKAENELHERTKTGLVKGKCGYLSPEQLSGADLDGRSDVFSLGIVAWELLTGHKLFQRPDDTELQVIKRIENCEQFTVPPSHLNKEVPPEVDALILKALKKDRDERWPSAGAFQIALRNLMRQLWPSYAYADAAQLITTLFESEIVVERQELHDLNTAAQQVLTAEAEQKTRLLAREQQGAPKGLSRFFGLSRKKHLPGVMEARLDNVESILKQRARTSHFVVAGLYLLAFVGLRMDDRYQFLDRIFGVEDDIQVGAIQPEKFRPKQIYRYSSTETPAPQSVTTTTVVAPEIASQELKKEAVRAPVRPKIDPDSYRKPLKARTPAAVPVKKTVVEAKAKRPAREYKRHSRAPSAKKAPAKATHVKKKSRRR